ncbi:hypothetical protein AB65_2691 [Escherichia coli 2-460-02_S1_C3]|nr:hypothetical protein AB65_2691 [Escherichia coli 2-460-02_S1_C3]PVF80085.1 hypothetical protein CSC15_2620 [Escherichia coli]
MYFICQQSLERIVGRDSGADTVTTLRRCCGKSGCHQARLSEEDDRVRPWW